MHEETLSKFKSQTKGQNYAFQGHAKSPPTLDLENTQNKDDLYV